MKPSFAQAVAACIVVVVSAQSTAVAGPAIRAWAGTTLFGAGQRAAQIRYDVPEPPPTLLPPGDGPRTRAPALQDNAPRSGEHRGGVVQKGSLLVWPKVEVRWAFDGTPVQDTFVTLNNDWNEAVDIHLCLVCETFVVVENLLTLSKNEPAFWSVLTGLPKGVSPFTVLGDPLPDPEGSGDLVSRGYLIAWAVDAEGRQISWNHLHGGAMVLNYADSAAWEYNATAFQVVNGAPLGQSVGTPGTLNLDGTEYDSGFTYLLFDFFASGSDALSSGGILALVDTDLTLLILDNDLRQDAEDLPLSKAHLHVWNANEVGMSGTEYCVTQWDERLLSSIGGHFLVQNLQTDNGRARVTGMASTVCDYGGLQSVDSALAGVTARLITFVGQ
jgi:hypothetical protein